MILLIYVYHFLIYQNINYMISLRFKSFDIFHSNTGWMNNKPMMIIGIILVSISSLVLIIGILVGLFVRFKKPNETNSLPNAQPGIMHQVNFHKTKVYLI